MCNLADKMKQFTLKFCDSSSKKNYDINFLVLNKVMM